MPTTTETETTPTTDPLLGFSSDEVVVGPGGQTLAQAAAEEQATRRVEPRCYALVMPPADGSRWIDVQLTRIAYGLWSQGFAGTVVGVLVDAGTGTTDAEIRAACTVTLLDRAHYSHVTGAVTAHVQCCLDMLEVTRDSLAVELAAIAPEDRAVAQRVSDLAEIEPAPGYEERAVERARREGLLPISDEELNAGGLPELRREIALALSADPDLPLADLVHAVRAVVIERREAREYGERLRRQLEDARRDGPPSPTD